MRASASADVPTSRQDPGSCCWRGTTGENSSAIQLKLEREEEVRERRGGGGGGYRSKIFDVCPGQMKEKYGRKQHEERDLVKLWDDEEQKNV